MGFLGSVLIIILLLLITIECIIIAKKGKRFIGKTALLWSRSIDWISEFCKHLCSNRTDAKYRSSTSFCKLWTDFFSIIIYWYRVSLKCRVTT